MLVSLLTTWFSSEARAATRVCVPADNDPACAYRELAAALSAYETDIELAPGTHEISATGWVNAPQTRIVALPGAVIADPGFLVLVVATYATDTVFEDLVFADGSGRIIGAGGGLIHVMGDGFTATNLTLDGIDSDIGDIESLITVIDAQDVEFDGLTASSGDGNTALLEVRHAGVVVDAPAIDAFTATLAPLLARDGSTLDVRDGHIDDSVGFFGDAVYADRSDVNLEGVNLAGGVGYGAGLVQVVDGGLTVDGCTLSSPEGGIYSFDTALVLADAASVVTIRDTTFADRVMPALRVTSAEALDVADVVFGGAAGAGAGVEAVDVDDVSIAGTWFCNPGGGDGSAIRLERSCDGGCALDRVVVADATASGSGSVWVDQGLLEVTNSSFVGNHAVLDGGAIEATGSAQLDLRRNLFVDQSGGGAAVTGELVAFADNAFGNNRARDLSGPWPDPDRNLRDVAAALTHDPADPCASAVRLADDPANDWLVDHRTGAFTPCYADNDGDGYGAGWIADGSLDCDAPGEAGEAGDCDDADATTFPGAPDPWYDGVDSDCAGNDDFDMDGDGVARDADCDDGTAEACAEGTTRRLLGGACSTAGPGASGGPGLTPVGWALGIALLRARTRRAASRAETERLVQRGGAEARDAKEEEARGREERDEVSGAVVDAAIEVHRVVNGP